MTAMRWQIRLLSKDGRATNVAVIAAHSQMAHEVDFVEDGV